MSGLSDHLHSGHTGAPVGCGGTQAEGKASLGGLEGLAGPELWTRELELQEGPQDPSKDGLALVTSDYIPSSSSPSALSNGLHLQRRLGHSSCRRRQTDTLTTVEGFSQTLRNMQTQPDPDVHAQAISHSQVCAQMDFNAHTDCVVPEGSRTLATEGIQSTSSQPLPLALGNHAGSASQMAVPAITAETDMSSTFCPVPVDPNPNPGSASIPAEAEKKYALRSSGRPRFPCHLRKSSRLRRGIEDGEKKAGQDRVGDEEIKVLEEKIWRIKEEEVVVAEKEEHSTVEAALRMAPCPTDIAHSLTIPKPLPKAMAKPGPKFGHRPGPKSRSRPPIKPVHKAAPKSVLKRRQAAQSMTQLSFANTSTITAPVLTVKEEPVADLGASSSNNRRRGRFVGVS